MVFEMPPPQDLTDTFGVGIEAELRDRFASFPRMYAGRAEWSAQYDYETNAYRVLGIVPLYTMVFTAQDDVDVRDLFTDVIKGVMPARRRHVYAARFDTEPSDFVRHVRYLTNIEEFTHLDALLARMDTELKLAVGEAVTRGHIWKPR